jgi:hypothetical protein
MLYNASMSFVDVHIVVTGGSNYFHRSYGGSKRDVQCEIACNHFFSYMAYPIDLKLCTLMP